MSRGRAVWGQRADLLRLLAALPKEEARDAAALLGFEEKPKRPSRREPAGDRPVDRPPQHQEELPEQDPVAPLAPVPMWRAVSAEDLGTTEERPPSEQGEGPTQADVEAPGFGMDQVPETEPLEVWASIDSRLQAALRARMRSRLPDVGVVVDALGRGELLERIPYRKRLVWPDAVEVWVDTSSRLTTIRADQRRLWAQLRRICGEYAVRRRVIDPDMQTDALWGRKDLLRGSSASSVLVLSDLGAGATPALQELWLQTGRRLARQGVLPVALLPVAPRRLSQAMRRVWQVVAWEATTARTALSEEQRQQRADRLVRLLSPAGLVQPGLLRMIRKRLPVWEADVGTEIDVLSHPAVHTADASGVVLHTEQLAPLREAFARHEPLSLQQTVSACIEAWHEGLPPELLWAEAITWSVMKTDAAGPGDLGAARAFFRRLRDALVHRSGHGSWAGWRHVGRAALEGVGEEAFSDPEIGALLGEIRAYAGVGIDGHRFPSTIPAEVLRAAERGLVRKTNPESQRWSVHQVGDRLRFALTPDAHPTREHPLPGSPITILRGVEHVWVGQGASREQWRLEKGLEVPLPTSPPLVLETQHDRHVLRHWRHRAEPGAQSTARDRFGLRVSLEVETTPFSMRWVGPGHFVMGSPPDESGRYDDEGPAHPVLLRGGFWLGETAVTQGLWSSLMGENPSRFVSGDRPVEQVSWFDAVRFCNALSARLDLPLAYRVGEGGEPDVELLVDSEGFRLPTEAEWEYACRAGTKTATWRGNLDIIGERNAPVLDEIAWYGGNSGVDFELDNGVDSSGWPEKQYDHSRAGTHPVAQKLPNPWGLYDMLGNVYEWCADHSEFPPEAYSESARTNPVQLRGSLRVFRGGSWLNYARYVRAAYRDADAPGDRSGSLGFRLARGPMQLPEARSSRVVVSVPDAGVAAEPQSEAPAQDSTGPVWVTRVGDVEHRMLRIKAGRFMMGSPPDEVGRFTHEGPVHSVELRQDFWLGETAVTQRLWMSLMRRNPSRFVSPDRPVERVSWFDAVRFCNALSGHLDLPLAYRVGEGERPDVKLLLDSEGFRLPTEAEWEYACRAGTTTATWRGDLDILGQRNAPILDEIAWYGGNSGVGFELDEGYDSSGWPEKQHDHSRAGTHPVAQKLPNPWGLYDMLGNVHEWCADHSQRLSGSYSESARTNPVQLRGPDRVFRGGSWVDDARYVRAAYRNASTPDGRYGLLGFRLARGPVQVTGPGGAHRSPPSAGPAEVGDPPERGTARTGRRKR